MDVREQRKKKKFWLAIGGSFNPVHRGHIETMERAKCHLEKEFGTGCVAGGFLAVAHQDWVIGKLGSEGAIKAHHRLAMANLAIGVEGREWFQPTFTHYGSSKACISNMVALDEYSVICDVAGGDRAKYGGRGMFFVNVGRPGYTESLAAACGVRPRDGGWYKMSDNVRFLNIEVGAHSSTDVRKHMKAGTLHTLVESGMIDKCIYEYLIEHQRDLFED